MKSAEEVVRDWWNNHGISKTDLAVLVRQAREEVREECAQIAGDYAAVYHGENTFGREYQAIDTVRKAICALDLK